MCACPNPDSYIAFFFSHKTIKRPSVFPQGRTQFLRHRPAVPSFAWQSSKAALFLPQNSVSETYLVQVYRGHIFGYEIKYRWSQLRVVQLPIV